MEWTEAIREAIDYMEAHLTEDIATKDVAEHVCISPFYFHKGFSILCGYSPAEYIRNRRLSLAAGELAASDISVTELAMKYGYDSPDSFARAFARFHGCAPSAVRRERATVKTFAPLKLTISLKGGYMMDYRIVKKESFSVLAMCREFGYENAKQEIPAFWKEYYAAGNGQYVCGMFGINIDPEKGNEKFEYLIADVYNPAGDIPQGFTVRTVPAFTWAVFPCRGPVSATLQDINIRLFSEWLPGQKEYRWGAGYCVEMYDAPDKYPKGTEDENYYAEIWIPVEKNKES